MASHTIQIELKDEQLAALDAVASRSQLDRNAVIENALENYLANENSSLSEIESGPRDTVPNDVIVAKLEAFIRKRVPSSGDPGLDALRGATTRRSSGVAQ